MKPIVDVSGVEVSYHFRQEGSIVVDDAQRYQRYLTLKKASDEKDKRIRDLEDRLDKLYELLEKK